MTSVLLHRVVVRQSVKVSVRFITQSKSSSSIIPDAQIGPTQDWKDHSARLGDDYLGFQFGNNLELEEAVRTNSFLSSNPILKRSAQRESNARTYVRKFPIVVAKGEGAILTDTDGKQYYDALGCAGTVALGHNHPVINQAITDTLASGVPLQILDFPTVQKDSFVTSLLSTFPEEFSRDARVQFCSPAGTDALEAAVKMCKTATGRRGVVAFHGGYHGHGHGTLAMMGTVGPKVPIGGLMSDVHFLPYPYAYRNPFGIAGAAGEEAVMNYIHTVLNDEGSGIPLPACVVVESIQGEGGVNPMSSTALRRLRAITAARGIPLVMDEVQAGFCRSGDFYGFNQSGIIPDVVAVSKAVGGSMPLAVLAYNKSLDRWSPGAHTGTFRGNTLAFACGEASIKYMQETKLWEQVAAKGAHLQQRLNALKEELPQIGDVRGRGLIVGVELVDPEGTPCIAGSPPPDGALAQVAQVESFRRGLIQERGGREGAVMRFLPPLVITQPQLDAAIDIFADALRAAVAKKAQSRP